MHTNTLDSTRKSVARTERWYSSLLLRKPAHMLIIDDAQETGVYTNARRDVLSHFVIKHQHIPIFIAILAQSWTGIPCVIRLNTTQFAVYKTGDKTQLKKTYNMYANVSKPHGFLFIQLCRKKKTKDFVVFLTST